MITFSIIIPTCNRPELLKICLTKLFTSTKLNVNEKCEIIVTDDSNDELSKDLVSREFPEVIWINGPKKGPASNRNNGAKLASGLWLIFLDDDIIPNENLLSSYLYYIKMYPSVKAFEGAILPDDWNLMKKDMAECPINDKGGCFWSANICIQSFVFNKLHGFDDHFFVAAQEDQDLFERLKLNTEVIFVKEAIVIHPVRFTSLPSKLYKIPVSINNYLLFVTKSHKNKWHILMNEMIFHLRCSIKSLIKLKFRECIYHIVVVVMLPFLILNFFSNNSF